MKNDEMLDAAVAAVRDEPIDAKGLEAARERVKARLAGQLRLPANAANSATATPAVAEATESHRIHGCEGFRALLPAYLAGALAEPKRVLVEDHTRECVGCRRALGELRRGTAPATPVGAPVRRVSRFGGRFALAAGLAGIALVSTALLVGSGVLLPKPTAAVQSIEGELTVVDGSAIRPAVPGETFGGATAVRTGGDSGAVVTLADGSKVELAERSELTLGRRWDGTVLELARGSVIVEAAKQRRGHLYVQTGDCRVAVVGTIFSVNSGTKGSRVSVIEGEVRVDDGTRRAVLRPGDQLATGRYLRAVPVSDEISWSRNAASYRERLAALKQLGRELDRTLASAGARTSTRLLDLAPEGTAVYVGLPNLSQSLAEAWSLVERRAEENPALADWWNERFPDGADAEVADAIAELARFGAELGPEIAVAVKLRAPGTSDGGDDAEPVVVATVLDPAGFPAILDEEIERLNSEGEGAPGDRPHLVRIAEPAQAAGDGRTLYVWLTGDLLVASPSPGRLAALGQVIATGANPFVETAFHDRLASVYADGTDWLLGVDLASVIADDTADAGDPERQRAVLDRLGFADLDQLVIDRRDGDSGDAGQNRAVLSFREERHGVASWLAAPAPLGAFEFVSPNAQFAVAGLLKDPAEMFDDVLAAAAAGSPEDDPAAKLAELEARLGISFRQDLAAALGGDVAFAVDGPLLPTPSWKLVLEVADAARLHASIQALVEAWNREAEASEDPRPTLRFTQESVDGRLLFTLSRQSAGGSPEPVLHALYADGYLVLGPSRPLLLEAVAQRAAGIQLATSQAFLDLVPRDGQAHFSALAYQNLGGSLGSLAELFRHAVPQGADGPSEEAAGTIRELVGDMGPALAVAYADGRAIRLVTRGLRGPLGMSFESLLALGGIFHSGPEAPAPPAAPTAAVPTETRPRQAA